MSGSRKLRRFGALVRNRDGVAAVEFALVAVPLFWLIFGMLEFGAMSIVQTSMDSAVAQAGRQIRTGIAQNGGFTKAQMEQQICDNLNEIMSLECAGNLYLDVDRYDSFADIGNGSPLNEGAIDQAQLNYNPGGANEVILVRAYYQWQIFTPMFGAIFSNMSDRRRLVVSSMMFRNEPF
jgi:Flp pilus assembly protein TadG